MMAGVAASGFGRGGAAARRLYPFAWPFAIYAVVMLALVPLSDPLRSFGIVNTAAIVQVNPLLALLFFAMAPGARAFFPTHPYQYLMIFAGFFGLVSAVASPLNIDPRNMASHIVQLGTAYVMFSAGRQLPGMPAQQRTMERLMALVLVCNLVNVLFTLRFVVVGADVYAVGSGSSLLLPLAYYLLMRPQYAAGTYALIIGSSKRGAMVAGLAIFALHRLCGPWQAPVRKGRNLGVALVTLAFCTICIAGIAMLAFPDIRNAIYTQVEMRISLIAIAILGGEGQAAAAGGRLEEAGALMSEMTPLAWLTGQGLGYTYVWTYMWNGAPFTENLHQVHFTPVTLAVRFGAPFAAAFYVIWLLILYRAFRAIRTQRDTSMMARIALYYAVAQFLNFFTAFGVFADLLFSFMLGRCALAAEQGRARSPARRKEIRA